MSKNHVNFLTEWFSLLTNHVCLKSRKRSPLHLVHVIDGTSGVQFVEHKVSLHLCGTYFLENGESVFGKPLCFRWRLRWVEAAEHLRELPVGAVAHVLFQVHPTRTDQCRIKP